MKNITINKKEAINTIIEQNESNSVSEIAIEVNYAREIIAASKGNKYKLVINGELIQSTDSHKSKLFTILRNMNNIAQLVEVQDELAFILFSDFIKFGKETVEKMITDNLPKEDIGINPVAAIISILSDRANKKIADVRKHIQAEGEFEVIYADLDQDLINFMSKAENTAFALTQVMGEGKTSKVAIPMFEQACAQSKLPTLVAPKRVLTSLLCSDERNYMNMSMATETQSGLVGVINSVVASPSLEAYKAGSVLIAEEHEEIIAQATGRAVADGSLIERANLLKGYMDRIKQTNTVVLMDAMFSTSQAEMIQRETGKKVVIVKSKDTAKNEVTINLLKESENVARASRAINEGKNVLAFSDAANKGENSKFNELYHSIAKDAKSSLAVTANTISELEDSLSFIKNIENEIAKNQFTMISPVINSGVSIQNGHADSVHFFGHQVVPVKAAIQTLKRDRLATEVNVSMMPNFSTKATFADAIIYSEMLKDKKTEEVSEELCKAYTDNQAVQNVAQVIAEENRMRVDYEASLIIALRLLGFEVKFDSDDEEAGREAKSQGRTIEAEERISMLMNAKVVYPAKLKELKEQNYITTEEKFQIARAEMEALYRTTITEELIAFDKKGERRAKVENNLIANDLIKSSSAATELKAKVIRELFTTLNVNSKVFTASFTKNEADEFVSKILKGSFVINNTTIKGTEAFKIAFSSTMPKGHSTTIVSKILSSKFGIKVVKTGQKTVNGKRVNCYSEAQSEMNVEFMDMMKRLYRDYQ